MTAPASPSPSFGPSPRGVSPRGGAAAESAPFAPGKTDVSTSGSARVRKTRRMIVVFATLAIFGLGATTTGSCRHRGETTSNSGARSSTAGLAEGEGRLAAARFESSAPVVGHKWRCRQVGGVRKAEGVVEVVSDEAGAFDLPEGWWSIESASGEFVAVERVVEAEAGAAAVFFVQSVGSLSFRTITPEGAPIAGVRCTWRPMRLNDWILREFDETPIEVGVTEADASSTLFSDAQGLVTFDHVPAEFGAASFMAEGRAPIWHRIVGGIEGVLNVAMRPFEGPGRHIRFVSALDGAPATDVSVFDGFSGAEIANVRKDADGAMLPAWAAPTTGFLKLRGPTIFPSIASIYDGAVDGAADRVFEVFGVCSATVRVGTPGASRSLVSLRISAADERGSRPDMSTIVHLIEGESRDLTLPAGCPLKFHAFGSDGRRGYFQTTLRGEAASIEIELGVAGPKQEIRVLGPTGAPIEGAIVGVMDLFELRESKTRTGPDGIATVSTPDAFSWVSIAADGCVGASLSKAMFVPASPPFGLGRFSVTLRPGVDAPLVFETPTGTPLIGAEVIVGRGRIGDPKPPPAAIDPDQGSGWISEVRSVSFGETDHKGRIVIQGVEPGAADVGFAQPKVKWSAFGWDWILTQPALQSVVFDGKEIRVVCDPPRAATLEVVDGATSTPVEMFRFGPADSDDSFEVRGSFWQGFVRPDLELLVVVPGVGRAQVPASAAIGLKPYRVVVRP